MFTIVVLSPEAKTVIRKWSSRAWAKAQAETLAGTLDSENVVQVLNRDGDVTASFTGRA